MKRLNNVKCNTNSIIICPSIKDRCHNFPLFSPKSSNLISQIYHIIFLLLLYNAERAGSHHPADLILVLSVICDDGANWKAPSVGLHGLLWVSMFSPNSNTIARITACYFLMPKRPFLSFHCLGKGEHSSSNHLSHTHAHTHCKLLHTTGVFGTVMQHQKFAILLSVHLGEVLHSSHFTLLSLEKCPQPK